MQIARTHGYEKMYEVCTYSHSGYPQEDHGCLLTVSIASGLVRDAVSRNMMETKQYTVCPLSIFIYTIHATHTFQTLTYMHTESCPLK